jgi:hypothetical protein
LLISQGKDSRVFCTTTGLCNDTITPRVDKTGLGYKRNLLSKN